jgi:hypothetical protein
MYLVAVLIMAVAALATAEPADRHWRKAEVVSVGSVVLFRYFEIIDSFDPSCRLTYREVTNPFKPLSLKKGVTVQIAGGKDNTVYLIDQRGRVHKGSLALQILMPPPIPPLRTP